VRILLILGLTAIAGPTLAQTNTAVSQDAGTSNMESAAETPLRNANIVRQTIPPIVLIAMAAPYARPNPMTCQAIATEVAALDRALGPDFDAGGGGSNTHLAPSAMKVAANTLIPFQGVLRFVSGAEAHDRKVIRAIIAGSARRSYLKGLGEARRCQAPASPEGAVPPARAAAPSLGRRRPRRR
jgi:hypothetical protein